MFKVLILLFIMFPAWGQVSFKEIKERVLVPHCLKCHRAMNNESFLAQWINLIDPDQSKFYLKVQSGQMPYQRQILDQELQDLILDYVRDFAEKRSVQKLDNM